MPVVKSYPFLYSSVYKLNNIDESYCGRTLLLLIKNSMRLSSSRRSIQVNVLREFGFFLELLSFNVEDQGELIET